MGWWNKASCTSVQGGSLPWGSLSQWGGELDWQFTEHPEQTSDLKKVVFSPTLMCLIYLVFLSKKSLVIFCSLSLLCVASSWWHYNKTFWCKLAYIYMEKAMATHSSTLAWNIPWTEEPGELLSMGSLRVGHDWATSLSLFTFMHWRRKWQPTPVFLPGESQGRGSLLGCRLWGRTELDTTEAT